VKLVDKSRYWMFPVLYMTGLFCVNTLSPDSQEKIAGVYLNRYVQDSLHIPLFAVLMFLWINAFEQIKGIKEKVVIYAFLICMAYTFFEEVVQTMIPGRYGSLSDVALNMVGCWVGMKLYGIYRKRKTYNLQLVADR
jgi:VanZ like family